MKKKNNKKMYNLYSEQKKLLQSEQKIKKEKETIIQEEKHKIKTNYLASNYQKRIKKFIIDVSKNTNEILIFRWPKKTLI